MSFLKVKKVFFVIWCVLLFFNSNAQHYHFENFGVKQGLAQSLVEAIYQDSRGFMWFGTYGGISRFDGISFKTFTASDGLSMRAVYAIIEDKYGNIWLGGAGGICVYDGKIFKALDLRDDGKSIDVKEMVMDKKGRIWVATLTDGIFRYDGKSFTNYTTDDGLLSNAITAICSDKKGDTWIGTWQSGISKFDQGAFQNITTDKGLISNAITALCIDRLKNLWIGTNDGLCRYNGNSFEKIESQFKVLNEPITSILEDKLGNIWISTKYKLVKYDGNEYSLIKTSHESFPTTDFSSPLFVDRASNIWVGKFGAGVFRFIGEAFTYFKQVDGLKPKLVFTISEDKIGNIWIGGTDGVSKWDKTKITTIFESTKFNKVNVMSIIYDSNGALWLGGNRNGLMKYDGVRTSHYTNKQGLIGNSVQSLLESSEGKLLIGTTKGLSILDDGLFENFDRKNGLSDDNIRVLFEDKNKIIWIGTLDGHVMQYDGKEFHNFSFFDSLQGNSVRSIKEDQYGNIWFGTFQGIYVYKSKNKMKNITEKNGLSSNVIYFLFPDEGYMWIGTSHGIDRIKLTDFQDLDKISIKHYKKESEIIGLEGNTNSAFKDSKGNIWFGMIEGAIKYNPSKDKPNTLDPFTHIKNIKMFYKNINWSEYTDSITKWNHLPTNLELPFEDNHLTFEFIGINHKMPEEVKYQWRLEGFEEDWSPISKETKVTYSNLPPDKSTFMIKACNEDNLWNKEPTTFSFTITPPYWQTAWYYGLQILFFTAIIGFTLFLSRSGRYESILTIFIFITIFVIFDYIQNMCEPLYEEYVGSATLVKTILNLVLAAFLIPAQRYVRNNLRGKRRKRIRERIDELV